MPCCDTRHPCRQLIVHFYSQFHTAITLSDRDKLTALRTQLVHFHTMHTHTRNSCIIGFLQRCRTTNNRIRVINRHIADALQSIWRSGGDSLQLDT